MKDLVIGCYNNYDWNIVQYWANSLKQSGFDGHKIMVVMNSDADTVKRLIDQGFMIIAFGQEHNPERFVFESTMAPHVERFFHIWSTLFKLDEASRPEYVFTTDVRDVVFQTNPSEWIRNMVDVAPGELYIASESIKYKNEPWGNQNLLETFGPVFHDILKEKTIYNVGTIAGTYEAVKDICLMIFQMSLGRKIPIVDQAVYNFILNQYPYTRAAVPTTEFDAFAATLGTTLDPNKATQFDPFLLETKPAVTPEGIVLNSYKDPFCMVHQWDRVPDLVPLIKNLYGDRPTPSITLDTETNETSN